MRTLKLLVVAALSALAVANELVMSEKISERQQCSGIYSKEDWSGSTDPFIDFAISKTSSDSDDDWVAVVIFEYRNVDLLGADIPNAVKKYVCDGGAIGAHLCDQDQLGQYIISRGANATSYGEIVTHKVSAKDPQAIHYPLKKTGFYCVTTHPSSDKLKYSGAVVFRNAFGDLAGSQIPKLPFFGGAALAYALVFALWMFSYVQHRADILPVQNYITAICGFLVLEMITIWGYYDYMNNGASKAGAIAYLTFLSIMNSFRNAFTFFLLLIVCMGYGVVKPSLGDAMWKCRALAGAHFLCAVLFTIVSYVVTPDRAGPIALFVILPLALTTTTFYVWILSSLTTTTKQLLERKQIVKAGMYKNLWRILLGSIIIIFAFFFINSLIFTTKSTLEFITTSWKSRWFILDGWLNVVYFADFCLIAFLWRPTANNRRFAMSTQLSQDEDAEEFEIGSMHSDDEEAGGFGPIRDDEDEDDAEIERMTGTMPVFGGGNGGGESSSAPQQPPPSYSEGPSQTPGSDSKKQAPSSSNGETVFAVGEDDDQEGFQKWDDDGDIFSSESDGEGEAAESQGLRKKRGKTD